MKRYIVDKKALEILDITTVDAHEELASDKIITNEQLEFSHLPFLSLVLTNEQVNLLKRNNIFPTEEAISTNVTLARPLGYERIRSYWMKTQRKVVTGRGCKVGVLDTGCNTAVCPAEFQVNYIDVSPTADDVFGHGTQVCSIIKHPEIALAPNCELHIIKVLSDGGGAVESAILSGLNYAIAQNLDIINLSWTFDTTNIRTAIANVVANGTIVAAASGNSTGVDNYTLVPATLPGVIAVNSITSTGAIFNQSVIVRSDIPGAHGVTVACSGVACQTFDKNGNYIANWGTSLSCPFFVGAFALYKEQANDPDNHKVLDFMFSRLKKQVDTTYFGRGIPSF